MTVKEIIIELKALSSPDHLAKLSHFGINTSKALGVKIPFLRQLAKKIGKDHDLALELWETEIHEARILATLIEDAHFMTENQFDRWVNDFDSWDMCDISCDLLARTPFTLNKIEEYSKDSKEFVKRTSFVLMCEHAVHYKNLGNEHFNHYFELIEREAWDDRNFVKKAVNWALRQIGKRNEILRMKAIETAERIMNQNTKSARWIAIDGLRELRNEKIIGNIKKKQ